MNPSTNVSAFSNFLCHKVARVFCGLLLTLWLVPSAFAQAQPGTTTPSATQREAEPRTLKLGEPIEREMAGGQSHAYQFTLAAGQYLYVVADQRGIDLVVVLFGPDGKKLI